MDDQQLKVDLPGVDLLSHIHAQERCVLCTQPEETGKDLLALDCLTVDLLMVDLLTVDILAVDLLTVELGTVDLLTVDLRIFDPQTVEPPTVDPLRHTLGGAPLPSYMAVAE